MKIGISGTFYPAVGGIESLVMKLAGELPKRGHEVTVITMVAGNRDDDSRLPFRVVRRPGPLKLLREIRGLDLVLYMGVALRLVWAAYATRTPLIISHQTWLERRDGRLLFREQLKRQCTRFCANIVASHALQSEPLGRTVWIPNCYDDQIFEVRVPKQQRRGCIFVGRLVSDKGADLLIEAVAKVRALGLSCNVTIVGDGPERGQLERMASELSLQSDITFVGRKTPQEIADLMRMHRILVVPSRWREPFGIVALEGIAAGCRVVASNGGGLPEVVGRFGRLFALNDVDALSSAIRSELETARPLEDFDERAEYLKKYSSSKWVLRYLEEMQLEAGFAQSNR